VRVRCALPILLLLAAAVVPAGGLEVCVGDCDGDGAIGVDEVLVGVNAALGLTPVSRCASFDTDGDGSVAINELLGAVRGALDGCRPTDPTPTPTPADFVASETDFTCLTQWERVRRFRIANPIGGLDAALAVARGEAPPPYPVGTIIQLVPQEAMVKRAPGFFPDAHDWEFFVLTPSTAGTQITQRGRGEVVNIGMPCFTCHGAAPHTDFVCETGNGCVALGLTEELITAIQNADPRCAPAP
jgi:hypothetical protein